MYVPTEQEIKSMVSPNRSVTPLASIIVNDWQEIAEYQENGVVNLQAFMDGTGTMWCTSVHYSEGKEPGTWHWPEIK
jgi:hypothetical protein